MVFEQFYLESLGHASYLVGDERTGRALVVDPRRDVGAYLQSARSHGLRIAYAIDTHGHNDYLSGLSELRLRQDMEALGFSGADLGYEHRSVDDGEVLEMGDVAFEVIHTPGHTPEHVSLLVHDRAAGDEPAMLLSGGALLVGDLGRPDLLGGPDAAREAAQTFCHTIQEKILWRLGDHVAVYPTHVKGSLCAGNIGSRLSTTVGFERRTNPVLSRITSSEEFVEECIRPDNLPAVPPYWRRMRAQNTLCVNPLPQKESVLGVVHSCGGCEGPQSRTPTEALLGGLTGDPECHSQLTPGVPETSGCNHGAGELLLGCCELSHRRLDGLQGAPVASMDEAAADHALAQGGAPGIAAGTQRHRPVGDHGAVFAVGTKHRVIGVAASGLCVNVA